MGGDYEKRNVGAQRAQERSVLQLYRRLLDLQRRERALVAVDHVALRTSEQLLIYLCRLGSDELLVVLNFSDSPAAMVLPEAFAGEVLLSTHLDCAGRWPPCAGCGQAKAS